MNASGKNVTVSGKYEQNPTFSWVRHYLMSNRTVCTGFTINITYLTKKKKGIKCGVEVLCGGLVMWVGILVCHAFTNDLHSSGFFVTRTVEM